MPATIENTPYLHTDENLKELTSREMTSALEKGENRKKVRENMEALLSNPENKDLVTDLRNIAAHAINEVKNDSDYVDKLLSLEWSSDGSYRGKQTYPDGSRPSAKDRSIYGVLCLYDQLMYQEQKSGKDIGRTPPGGWKGKGLFEDAQFWLQHIRDAGVESVVVDAEKSNEEMEEVDQETPAEVSPQEIETEPASTELEKEEVSEQVTSEEVDAVDEEDGDKSEIVDEKVAENVSDQDASKKESVDKVGIEVTDSDLMKLAIPILQLQRVYQGSTNFNPSKVWVEKENGNRSTQVLDEQGNVLLEIIVYADGTGTISTSKETITTESIQQLQDILGSMVVMDEEDFKNMVGSDGSIVAKEQSHQEGDNNVSHEQHIEVSSRLDRQESNNETISVDKSQEEITDQKRDVVDTLDIPYVIVGEGSSLDFAKHNAIIQLISAVSRSLDKENVVGGEDYVILDQSESLQSDGSYKYTIGYKIISAVDTVDESPYSKPEEESKEQTPIVKEQRNIDSPLLYGSKEWLASKLVGKLEGISLEQFSSYIEGKSISIDYSNPYNKDPLTINTTIAGVANPVLRDKILSYIDRGDIRGMYQDIYGMHDNKDINPYLHYRPSDVINGVMMHAMSLRLWHTHDVVENKEQMDRMQVPDDVRKAWKDYKKLKLHLLSENNGPNNFAIVSKTDFKMYLFLPDGTLVGKQNVLVGKNPSDTQRLVDNTPSGKYKTNGFFNKPVFNGKYYDKGLGNYIKLWSLEDKFRNSQRNDAGIGVHELYDPNRRAGALLDDVTKDPLVRNRKLVSDGCINASNSPLDFGAIFTHLVPKSDIATCVYVTPVPDQNAVSHYYSMLESQAAIAME